MTMATLASMVDIGRQVVVDLKRPSKLAKSALVQTP